MRTLLLHLRRLARAGLRLRRHQRGNVAVTFALALIPLLAFIGAAIDYSRANAMRVDLQAALDSTALMVSKNAAGLTQDQLTSTARPYFLSLFHNPQAQITSFTITYSTSGGSSVVVAGAADMQTEFMSILGLNTITIGGSATARWGSTRLRVALVLDTTGSMADSGKMTALKTATKNLLTQLQSAASVDGDVYVSIIPFSKDVNAGTGNYASWNSSIDWSQDWTNVAPSASTSNSTPSADVGPGSSCPYNSRNDGYTCVTQPGGPTQTNTIPSSGSNKGYICPSNSFGCYDSVATTTTTTTPFCTGRYCSCWGHSNCSCTGYGNNTVCSQTTTTTSYTHTWFVDKTKWNGCLTDRGDAGAPSSQNYDRNVTATTSGVAASQFPAEQHAYCPPQMMGLSYNWSAMKSAVDNLYPLGATNQPIGLVWGWQSLVGGGPFTAPAMDSNYTYKQAIILLSDGLNTQDRWYGNGYDTSTAVDARMHDSSGAGTCANIKAAGITLYTIQVNTAHDPTSSLLQHCASSSDKFFLLTSADQIITTFQKIGTDLSQLRIAK
jgi:Flp pilus assembly protein TadG